MPSGPPEDTIGGVPTSNLQSSQRQGVRHGSRSSTRPPARRSAPAGDSAVTAPRRPDGAGSGSTGTNVGPAPVAVAPPPPDADIERFLLDGKVGDTHGTKKGVTGAQRATLSTPTLTHDAQIQSIDEFKREFRTDRGVEFDFRDSWTFNVAAYKIDRLIGLNMVPVSVERKYRSTPVGVHLVARRRADGRGRSTEEEDRSARPGLLEPPDHDDAVVRSADLERRPQHGKHPLHEGLAALADRSHPCVPEEHGTEDALAHHAVRSARSSRGSRPWICRRSSARWANGWTTGS